MRKLHRLDEGREEITGLLGVIENVDYGPDFYTKEGTDIRFKLKGVEKEFFFDPDGILRPLKGNRVIVYHDLDHVCAVQVLDSGDNCLAIGVSSKDDYVFSPEDYR